MLRYVHVGRYWVYVSFLFCDGNVSCLILSSSSSPQCNLWVSGLAASVRALDLQTLFSRYGQVTQVCVTVGFVVDCNHPVR